MHINYLILLIFIFTREEPKSVLSSGIVNSCGCIMSHQNKVLHLYLYLMWRNEERKNDVTIVILSVATNEKRIQVRLRRSGDLLQIYHSLNPVTAASTPVVVSTLVQKRSHTANLCDKDSDNDETSHQELQKIM